MPNGDPDFHTKELPTLERFFARLAPAITRFAERHSLRIQRYYHDLPSWQLCFDHPAGGSAYVELRRVDDDTFRVHSVWWLDDRPNRKRRSRFSTGHDYPVSASDIDRVLGEAYDAVRAWKQGEWTLVSEL